LKTRVCCFFFESCANLIIFLHLQIVWRWDVNQPHRDDEVICVISVDGTHCRIREPRGDPNANWFSHKSHGPGLNYEIGLDVYESKLVWISGPFRASENDLAIFKKADGLKSKMPPGKMAIGDRAYKDTKCSIRNPFDSADVKKFKRRVRGRHEGFNRRIKIFKVLSETFRNNIDKHQCAFEAVCVIVQYEMENGYPLFEV
jgi:hypothetical protein